jgi:hypothetical protein
MGVFGGSVGGDAEGEGGVGGEVDEHGLDIIVCKPISLSNLMKTASNNGGRL